MHKLPFLESSEARGRRNSRAGVIRSAVDVVDVIVVVVLVDVVDVNSRAGVTHSVAVAVAVVVDVVVVVCCCCWWW